MYSGRSDSVLAPQVWSGRDFQRIRRSRFGQCRLHYSAASIYFSLAKAYDGQLFRLTVLDEKSDTRQIHHDVRTTCLVDSSFEQ